MNNIAENIRKLRENAGMTQEELAGKTDLSRSSISQIESGDRKVTSSELATFADIFNTSSDRILGRAKEPEIKVLSEGKLEKHQDIRIDVPQKNIDKLREVILYILNKVGAKPNIGETVLYKLLYFMDFNFYELYEEQFIGATYQKNKYGPTPVEFSQVIKSMKDDIAKVKDKYFEYPQTKYLPKRTPDLSLLSAREIKIVDSVLNKLSDMNAKTISDYSHGDVPWKATPDNKIIPYETVFYRTPEYSVREYEDEI